MTSDPGRFYDRPLVTQFVRLNENAFSGFAFDPGMPARRLVIELRIDGVHVRAINADMFDSDAADASGDDGCHGFLVVLDPDQIADARRVEAWVANADAPFAVIWLDQRFWPVAAVQVQAAVAWQGGLRITGRLPAAQTGATVKLKIKRETFETRADRWGHVITAAGNPESVANFRFELPLHLADGRAHLAHIHGPDGVEMSGSPVSFSAYGYQARWIAERLGLDLSHLQLATDLEKLLPSSLPLAAYAEWKTHCPEPAAESSTLDIGVILIGDTQTGASEETLLGQTHANWNAAAVPAEADPLGFAVADVLEFLETDAANADVLVFAPSGTRFSPAALARFAEAFTARPDLSIVYPDIEICDENGTVWPLALPAFDNERLLEQGYCCYMFAVRRAVVLAALAQRPHSLFDLFFCCFDQGIAASMIGHLPYPAAALALPDPDAAAVTLMDAVKAHLARHQREAIIEPRQGQIFASIHVRRPTPLTGCPVIVAVTGDGKHVGRFFSRNEAALRAIGAELVLACDDDVPLAEAVAEGGTVRMVRVTAYGNRSRLLNAALATVSAPIALVVSDRVEMLEENGFKEIISRLHDTGAAIAGPALVGRDGILCHAGYVLGPAFSATSAFCDHLADEPGYGNLLRVAHQCSAISSDCMAMDLEAVRAVGGFDARHFPSRFADIDLCLRLRAAGKSVILTPHAIARIADAASRAISQTPSAFFREARVLAALRLRWRLALESDPFYSPILNRDGAPYAGLTLTPPSTSLRFNTAVEPDELAAWS
jgi:O-antigen biosynthesis protein